MTSSEPAQSPPPAEAQTPVQKFSETSAKPEQKPASMLTQTGMTSEQAEQIITQLKSLKQNVFILTLVAGFFALRAILFHR